MRPNQEEEFQTRDKDEVRRWIILDKIDKRLSTIETTLINIVRLDEKVMNHSAILDNLNKKFEDHESRLRSSELTQTRQYSQQDNKAEDISELKSAIKEVKSEVTNIKITSTKENAKKGWTSYIITWLGGILAAILTYKITK